MTPVFLALFSEKETLKELERIKIRYFWKKKKKMIKER
jgi:hypothetical protein